MKGCIIKRGDSWRLKFDAGRNAHGKRQIYTETFRGTRKEAEKKLAKLLTEANEGTLVAKNKLTLADHLRSWLEGKNDLTPLTRQRYTETIESHLIPTLGGIELQKLTVDHVDAWLIAMRDGKRGQRSARTIVHSFRLLHGALKSAVKKGKLARNVADCADPPKAKKATVPILKANDVPTVLAALKDNRIYPIVALALSTGARRSELLALRWCDVDLKRGTLNILHALEQTKAGLRLKSPKTESGKRTVMLPAFAVTMLGEHRKAQLELRMQLGMGKAETEAYVFSNHDGAPISPNYFSIMWSRAVARAGLPDVTFHSLRHSHASALIRAGLDVMRVSKQLGHSNPAITLTAYTHEFKEGDSGAADAINKVLG